MPSMVQNETEYGNGGVASQSYVAEYAVSDVNGNFIHETYAKNSDYRGFVETIEEQPNAGFHNSFYRGKDITEKFTTGVLYERIADGTFKDLYIGDFFKAVIDGTEGICRLAGFDILLRNGDTSLDSHHAVIVPDTPLMQAPMNATNTTVGAYSGSVMRQTTLPALDAKLESVFGAHLLTHRELVAHQLNPDVKSARVRTATGATSSWEWVSIRSCLMTDQEVLGAVMAASSGHDIGTGKAQLPLFKLNPALRFISNNYWLKDVVSTTDFAFIGNGGLVYYSGASIPNGVRPRWIID